MYLMVVSFTLHSKVDVLKLHVFIGGCASVRKTSYLRRRHKSASVVLATLTAMVIVVMLSRMTMVVVMLVMVVMPEF